LIVLSTIIAIKRILTPTIVDLLASPTPFGAKGLISHKCEKYTNIDAIMN